MMGSPRHGQTRSGWQTLLLITPALLWLVAFARVAHGVTHDKGGTIGVSLVALFVFAAFPALCLAMAVAAAGRTEMAVRHPILYYGTIIVAGFPILAPLLLTFR
jgi:hypothetical protein